MCSLSVAMCSVSGRMCSLLSAMCPVFGGARPPSRPPLAGSEQALQGRRDDGGRGPEDGGWARLGMCSTRSGQCVQILARAMCPTFSRPNVSSFWPNVFSFEGDVSTLAGDVSSFRRGALVGDGARSEGEIPRLRCAALGMTEAAAEVRSGCGRDGVTGCAAIDHGAGYRLKTPGCTGGGGK